MALPKGFEIVFASDTRFEFLMVEIYCYGYRVLQLSRESGMENIEIEFLLDLRAVPKEIDIKFSLVDFYKVLEIAKNDLINYGNDKNNNE